VLNQKPAMAKNLVIVESPAKAKTIEKILGKDFVVESSYGHIADLPSPILLRNSIHSSSRYFLLIKFHPQIKKPYISVRLNTTSSAN